MKSEPGDDKKNVTPPAGDATPEDKKPEEKKPGIDAEKIILKAQSTVNEVILPKLKGLYAMSKAAVAGAVKGVKDMNKGKDESKKDDK